MLDQNTTVILAALIAALATILGSIIGGIVLPYLTQKLSVKAEKRQIIREKIEEMFTLTIQIKFWAQVQVAIFCIELSDSVYTSENVEFWTSYDKTFLLETDADKAAIYQYAKEAECPIVKLEMLSSLYTPSLKDQVRQYSTTVSLIKGIHPIKMQIERAENMKFMKEQCVNFQREHLALQSSFEKLISQN